MSEEQRFNVNSHLVGHAGFDLNRRFLELAGNGALFFDPDPTTGWTVEDQDDLIAASEALERLVKRQPDVGLRTYPQGRSGMLSLGFKLKEERVG